MQDVHVLYHVQDMILIDTFICFITTKTIKFQFFLSVKFPLNYKSINILFGSILVGNENSLYY